MTNPIRLENAEHYLWGTHCEGWHLVRAPELSVIQERVPPGECEPATPTPARASSSLCSRAKLC